MNSFLLGMMRTGLFNGLNDDTISHLLEQVEELEVSQGEWVIREDEPADSFYIILTGELEAITHTAEGQETQLGLLSSGGFFGEQALLPGSSGQRMASVRSLSIHSKLLRLSKSCLEEMIQEDSTLERRLVQMGDQYAENKMALRSTLVQELLAEVDAIPERVNLENGVTLFRQGEANQGFYVILHGSVELLQEDEGLPTRLARLGPGLCLGVQDGETYASTAIAHEKSSLLLFSHEALSVVTAKSPEVREHLAVAQKVWDLPQQGFVTQYLDKVDGKACLTQHYYLPESRDLIAYHPVGDDSIQLIQPSAEGSRTIETPDESLSVILDESGTICSLWSSERNATLGILFGRAIEGRPLLPEEVKALEEQGELKSTDHQILCTCLQVPRSAVLAALKSGATSLEALQQRTGAGLSCGTCIPSLKEILGEGHFQEAIIQRMEEVTPNVRRVFFQTVGDEPLPPSLPGQYIVLRVALPDGVVERPYTLSGATQGPWEVTIKWMEQGVLSEWLFKHAKVGTSLEVSLPQGDFVWDGGPSPVVCLVGGIGITPALAMARTLLAEGWPHWLVIDWSTSSPTDAALWSDLKQAAASNLLLRSRYTSQEPRLSKSDTKLWHQRFPSARYFLCGPQSFMNDTMKWLLSMGVPSKRIYTENFRTSN